MKVVFPTCCGIDVHKSFVVATIIKTPKDSIQPSYQKKRFSTFNSDLKRFADWLHENDCLDVCMESTGKYWVPVFNILEKQGIRVVIANPKWVKAVKGNKDDTKDSKWIGDLFRISSFLGRFVPVTPIWIDFRNYLTIYGSGAAVFPPRSALRSSIFHCVTGRFPLAQEAHPVPQAPSIPAPAEKAVAGIGAVLTCRGDGPGRWLCSLFQTRGL